MSELRDLYQEYILDHGKHPRNFRFPEPSNRVGNGYNPLCGDKLVLKINVDGDVIQDIGFQGSGCAISMAAASTMTEAVKGKSLADAQAMFDKYHKIVTGEMEPDLDEHGTLAVFAGVREFPMRVKCATLAWHTLNAALRGEGGEGEEVSTE